MSRVMNWRSRSDVLDTLMKAYPLSGAKGAIEAIRKEHGIELTKGQVSAKAFKIGLRVNDEVLADMRRRLAEESENLLKGRDREWGKEHIIHKIPYYKVLEMYYPRLGSLKTHLKHLPMFTVTAIRRKASRMGLVLLSEVKSELSVEAGMAKVQKYGADNYADCSWPVEMVEDGSRERVSVRNPDPFLCGLEPPEKRKEM